MAPTALRPLLALALLATLLPPPAGAQEAPTGVRILADASNDLQADAGTGSVAPAPVPRGAMDLRSLDVLETLDNLTFVLGVSPYTQTSDQGQGNIHFAHGDAQFRLHFEQRSIAGWWWMFSLYRVEPEGESFVTIGEALPADASEGVVVLALQKKDVADRGGVIPFVGRQLTGFWAETSSYSTPLPLRDRMPDTGVGPDFTFALGEAQSGDVELWSSSPTRASNGEATTVVYTVTARHAGSDPARFVFAADGVPDGWSVVFPQPAPVLGPGEQADYPVLVGLPFRHQHGHVEDVRVTLTSMEDDAHRGSVRLSVNYHTVPQPAGHHPTVYLHSSTLGDIRTPVMEQAGLVVWNRVWMNTLDDFDGDDELAVPGLPGAPNTWTWTSPLDPVLQMGLDFDLERHGVVDIPFSSRLGIPDATLAGTLDVEWQDPESGEFATLPLADLVPQGEPGLPADAPQRLTAAIVPRAEADLVPYREGANLVLRLVLSGTPATGTGVLGPEKPWLEPGGFLSLPLFEYSDPVDGLFSSLQGVEVLVDGGAQRKANPGETVRFPLDLRFRERAQFQVTFAGQGAEHARVVGGPDLVATPQGSRFEVAVTMPADAGDGDLLDILVIVQRTDDPDVQGIVRIVPEADTEADHADAPVADVRGADAPALPAWLALSVLAALALRRRRA